MRTNGGMTTEKGMLKGMSKGTVKVLVAFAVGQAAQIVIHAVSMNFWENRRILFCSAAGFLICAAVFAGAWLNRDSEPKHTKSYMDYAEDFDEQ